MNFKDLELEIPQTNPRIQIGPLSIWIFGFTIFDHAYGYSTLGGSCLLKTDRIMVFSPSCDVLAYELKKLKEGLVSMYEKAGTPQSFESDFLESEFGIKFASDQLGHIEIIINYHSWAEGTEGKLEVTDIIDQSYLPEIIKAINSIQLEFKIDDVKLSKQIAEANTLVEKKTNIIRKLWPLWVLIGLIVVKIVVDSVRY